MELSAVHIMREPVLTMIARAIETGRRECLGELFGKVPAGIRKDFLVSHASALRMFRWHRKRRLTQDRAAADRLFALMQERPRAYPRIGFFHSHPQWSAKIPDTTLSELSAEDVAAMIELGTAIEIIVAVGAGVARESAWAVREDGSISGPVLGRRVSLHAYRLIAGDSGKIPQQIPIIAPSALRILNSVGSV